MCGGHERNSRDNGPAGLMLGICCIWSRRHAHDHRAPGGTGSVHATTWWQPPIVSATLEVSGQGWLPAQQVWWHCWPLALAAHLVSEPGGIAAGAIARQPRAAAPPRAVRLPGMQGPVEPLHLGPGHAVVGACCAGRMPAIWAWQACAEARAAPRAVRPLGSLPHTAVHVSRPRMRRAVVRREHKMPAPAWAAGTRWQPSLKGSRGGGKRSPEHAGGGAPIARRKGRLEASLHHRANQVKMP